MVQPAAGPGRHQARERVIELLYERDLRELTVEVLLDQLPLEPLPYATQALRGIGADQVRIDQLIERHTHDWTIDRLPQVDRAILRLAVWELLERPDVPAAVVIDEAVELAKEYSTERSSSFVNGVLDAIAGAVAD